MMRDIRDYETLRLADELRDQVERERRATRALGWLGGWALVLVVWLLARFDAVPDSVIVGLCFGGAMVALLRFAAVRRT